MKKKKIVKAIPILWLIYQIMILFQLFNISYLLVDEDYFLTGLLILSIAILIYIKFIAKKVVYSEIV